MKKGLIIKYILGIMAIVMAVLEIYVLDYGGMWLIVVVYTDICLRICLNTSKKCLIK